jgi:exopolyphosphatase/pppGpp-phosphohydrolase
VIDIGGASTELVIGEQSEAKLLNSLHMGCVTWLNNHFGDGELSEARFNQAIAAAKAVLEKVAADYRASAGAPASAPPAPSRRCRRSCWPRARASGSPCPSCKS